MIRMINEKKTRKIYTLVASLAGSSVAAAVAGVSSAGLSAAGVASVAVAAGVGSTLASSLGASYERY